MQWRLVAQLRDCLREDDGTALTEDQAGGAPDHGRDHDPEVEEAVPQVVFT